MFSGSGVQCFDVTIFVDGLTEGNEIFTLSLSSLFPRLIVDTATVMIMDELVVGRWGMRRGMGSSDGRWGSGSGVGVGVGGG